jgi:hypothetical protein
MKLRRSSVKLAAGWLVLAIGCSSESAVRTTLVDSHETHLESMFAACGTITCGDPGSCAQQCEAAWGESSGKSYSILSACSSSSTTTNSDCYSRCFTNCCCNGSLDGNSSASCDESGVQQCTCGRTPNGIHNYWCCGSSGQTIQGWSSCDWCEYPNGDGSEACNEDSGSGPSGGSSSGSTGGSSSGSSRRSGD